MDKTRDINKDIYALRISGETYSSIGKSFGISPQSVRQRFIRFRSKKMHEKKRIYSMQMKEVGELSDFERKKIKLLVGYHDMSLLM